MPDTIKNPVLDVFSRWSTAISLVVGKGNFSMDRSQTIAPDKKMYARLFMLGNPTARSDLEGDECATMPSFQAESYASGIKASSKMYEIDAVSHQSMCDMGFRRTYGPTLQNGIVISRYSRIYTGNLL